MWLRFFVATTQDVLASAEKELLDLKQRIVELRKEASGETVEDYVFQRAKGEVRLSELFGDSSELIVIHNMGKSCTYCTMWADGFQGLLPHIRNRAPFVVSSPDGPNVQQEFAAGRGWTFPIVSTEGTTFREDMGFDEGGKPTPGVSTFRKEEDGGITRVSHAAVGPGDDFCSAWHLFDMLPRGAGGWESRYYY